MISTVIINRDRKDRGKIFSLIASQSGFRVLAQGKDGYDALKLIGSLKPNIAIMDTELEYIEGEEIPPLLRVRSPSTAVIILIAGISDYKLHRAVSNEVSGLVCKETDLDALPQIIRCIHGGGCYISPALAARILRLFVTKRTDNNFGRSPVRNTRAETLFKAKGEGKIASIEDPAGYLSKMELRILTYIGEGYTSAEIADKMYLGYETIKSYRKNLHHKLDVHSTVELTKKALELKLV